MVSVLMVPVEGVLRLVDAPVGASGAVDWAAMVGGYAADMVFASDGGAMAVVGAHGKALGAEVNSRASVLVDRPVPGFTKRDVVAGVGVFVGLDDAGVPVDVPVGLVQVAEGLFGPVDRLLGAT